MLRTLVHSSVPSIRKASRNGSACVYRVSKKLTHNATSATVALAIKAGLVPYRPLRPFGMTVRGVLVTPEVLAVLQGHTRPHGFPSADAEVVISRFMAGHLMNVSRKSAPGVHLEQLEKVDEVWALCFRKPPPGWRLFGRFIEQDTFVGTALYDRYVLSTRPKYTRFAMAEAEEWSRRFPGLPYLTSPDLADYLTGVYYDADAGDAD